MELFHPLKPDAQGIQQHDDSHPYRVHPRQGETPLLRLLLGRKAAEEPGDLASDKIGGDDRQRVDQRNLEDVSEQRDAPPPQPPAYTILSARIPLVAFALTGAAPKIDLFASFGTSPMDRRGWW